LFCRPEDAIRAYFASGGKTFPSSIKQKETEVCPFPAADEDTFKKWFPGLALSRTAVPAPKLRLVCFANAGNAEDMYTSEGTGIRKSVSPLLEWCRENQVECLAPQYPGRALRLQEPRITKATDMAAALLPIVASKLYDTPWVLIAHSVGTWIGFEFLHACRKAGIPPPKAVFLSAMPCPTTPFSDRPWRQQRSLNEDEFKEECRGWDIAEIVFSNAMWPMYHPLLRADFTIFDEYEYTHKDKNTHNEDSVRIITCPLYTFWGTSDRRVKEHHVKAWKEMCSGSFQCEKVDGNHLWPADKVAKAHWLGRIVDELKKIDDLL
jgi:medium-chain acyl-[acyl-carrier-protein] hydrolase